ncbi:hypothetical protein R70006_05008 [Paraburkholderia domus]|uniref:DUF3717 domain-containing protein n=1 Tax=Paraburkholderia domus TaxID=2793075 RepID=UPI0019120613|nr:DUF3717 domain-containing protein [Paraburkholderia domus]MBK5051756.1 DUF3717 domain-containing protein [Burkholderia sp. R-70006]CAE6794537.1 hypothetical protein R70006_05008 [Paraburkholderia domus]
MAKILSREQVEMAINRCRDANPPMNGMLSAPLSAMAKVLGLMLWSRVPEIDIEQFGREVVDLYSLWGRD